MNQIQYYNKYNNILVRFLNYNTNWSSLNDSSPICDCTNISTRGKNASRKEQIKD